jgi:tRNA modification GTPase
MSQHQTLYALSSGRLPSGVAIIRISGPQAFEAGEKLCGSLPVPSQHAVRSIFHPITGDVIDKALVLTFKGPHVLPRHLEATICQH